MPKYSVIGVVSGGKYIGTFEAENENDAIEQAMKAPESWISFCHQCADQCEDPQILEFVADRKDE